MTESESALMIETFRSAWPDDPPPSGESRQVAKLFRAYSVQTVTEVIEDRVEAELGRPSPADLSRVLRAYAPKAAKSDSDTSPPQRPANPWIKDMPDLPFVPPELELHIAEMRDRLDMGRCLFEARPRTVPEPVTAEFVAVPPSIRDALAEGVKAGAVARSERISERVRRERGAA